MPYNEGYDRSNKENGCTQPSIRKVHCHCGFTFSEIHDVYFNAEIDRKKKPPGIQTKVKGDGMAGEKTIIFVV